MAALVYCGYRGWLHTPGRGGKARRPTTMRTVEVGEVSPYIVAVLANLDPPAAQRISDYLDPRLPTQR